MITVALVLTGRAFGLERSVTEARPVEPLTFP